MLCMMLLHDFILFYPYLPAALLCPICGYCELAEAG